MLDFLFNNKVKEALRKGAVIIDVRPAHQFDEGKIPDSINIPVDRIAININRIKSITHLLYYAALLVLTVPMLPGC